MKAIQTLFGIVVATVIGTFALMQFRPDNTAPPPISHPAKPEPKQEPKEKPIEWADAGAGQLQTIGGLSVGVNRTAVGRIQLLSLGQPAESNDEHLVMRVVLMTKDPTKRFAYSSWQDSILSKPTLKDEHGNTYPLVTFGFGTHAIGHVDSASIYSDSSATDILVFDKPVPAAKKLFLELPGRAVSVDGTFRFTFDAPEPLNSLPPPRQPESPKPTASKAKPEPRKTDPPAPPPDPEKRAAQKLQFARDLAASGKIDKARERFQEIIREFPDTKAAAEAKIELAKMPP